MVRLMARGYSAEDCRKILGGNLLRIFREVEQVAKEIQAENRPGSAVKHRKHLQAGISNFAEVGIRVCNLTA
jgi:hypothetical protein